MYKNDIDVVNTTLLRQKNLIKMCDCSIMECLQTSPSLCMSYDRIFSRPLN